MKVRYIHSHPHSTKSGQDTYSVHLHCTPLHAQVGLWVRCSAIRPVEVIFPAFVHFRVHLSVHWAPLCDSVCKVTCRISSCFSVEFLRASLPVCRTLFPVTAPLNQASVILLTFPLPVQPVFSTVKLCNAGHMSENSCE